MPSVPSVLIIGVNPIVRIVVPMARSFGFRVAHLWSYHRFTSETISLCKDILKIESYSCTLVSLEQLLNNTNEPYLIFVCTETDQHASLLKRLTTASTGKSFTHHIVCMPPFHVDPKILISTQSIQQQLCCYCYPLGFLPTFIKLKRYLIEEQVQLGKRNESQYNFQFRFLQLIFNRLNFVFDVAHWNHHPTIESIAVY